MVISTQSDVGRVIVDDVSKEFRSPAGAALRVLDHVSLDIQPGEFVTIVGPSGCGKTTLLRLMQGLDTWDSGNVLVGGGAPGTTATGFVFQRASLLPWRTVKRNVAFGLDLAVLKDAGRGTKADRRAHIAALLELTNLTDFSEYYPSQISGGMQQRTNLARALAIQPSVLLMDEPFSALDAQTREKLQRDLQKIVAQTGTTTVFITHDIREAVFQADRVVVMSARPGRIIATHIVEEPRPRTAEFQQSDRLAELSRHIWEQLHSAAPPTAPY